MSNRFTQKAQNALNRALSCASELGHTYIGSEHILLGLAGETGSIAQKFLSEKGGNFEKLYKIITEWAGIGSPSMLSPNDMTPKVKNIIESSAIESSKNGHSYIGTEHILLSLLSENECMAQRVLNSLGIKTNDLKKELTQFIDSIHSHSAGTDLKKIDANQSVPGAPVLSQYGRNLTLQASHDKLDPTIGREKETMRVIQILSRRTKNNPCLIGEPGVGKTAVVEGLAQKIIDGKVPEILRDKIIVTLDIAGMIAGAKYRGEFEDRMKNIMEEVRKNRNIILFIDEIHIIIGAGAAEGAIDAANIIKPALARGQLQVIGATTMSEYSRHIEKDSALERRFQSVVICEPSQEEAVAILHGLRDKYEAHHGLSISDEALEAAVALSSRYIPDRFLPDKAIDLIDEASSLKKINVYTTPPELLEVEERLCLLANEKEEAIISQDFESAARLRDEEISLKNKLEEGKSLWDNTHNECELKVTAEDICSTITLWTGIPVNLMDSKTNIKLLELEERLKKRIVGQDAAIKSVTDAIIRGQSGLRDPVKPMGVFLFCGRTGVGKTELSVALADEMFGKQNFIRIDMSEFAEKHSISKLIGSPPGYVGYEEGGRLTEAVRRRPHSIVLFDEIEKAHPDIYNILLQICDDGRLTDSQGRTVNFCNTIIIMTSNIGFNNSSDQPKLGFSEQTSDETKSREDNQRVLKAVKQSFPIEFINRLDEIIVFEALSVDTVVRIINIILNSISRRAKQMGITLIFSNEAVLHLAKIGYDAQYGARNLKRTITSNVENLLSRALIEKQISENDEVNIDFDGKVITMNVLNKK